MKHFRRSRRVNFFILVLVALLCMVCVPYALSQTANEEAEPVPTPSQSSSVLSNPKSQTSPNLQSSPTALPQASPKLSPSPAPQSRPAQEQNLPSQSEKSNNVESLDNTNNNTRKKDQEVESNSPPVTLPLPTSSLSEFPVEPFPTLTPSSQRQPEPNINNRVREATPSSTPITSPLPKASPTTEPKDLSQKTSSTGEPQTSLNGIPVKLDNRTVAIVQVGVGAFSPQARAEAITKRIQALAEQATSDVKVILEEVENNTNIVANGKVLMTVRDIDAKVENTSRVGLAEIYREQIEAAIADYRKARSPYRVFLGIGIAILATIGLFVFLRFLGFLSRKGLSDRGLLLEGRIPAFQVAGIEILPASNITEVLIRMIGIIKFVLFFAGIYLYFSFVLSLFVWTEALGATLLQYILRTLSATWLGLGSYIPNIFNIGITIFVTQSILQFMHFFFDRMRRGELHIDGFYSDWIDPTEKLISWLIIALSFAVALPFIPGFNSPAFQGVSIFVGVLVSLGSTETVTNIVSGIILIYARSFQVGDRVKVADIVGDVIEKTLIVTRVRSPKNVVITIPNSMVLHNFIINYSTLSKAGKGLLILHTAITLGYDAPWRKVYEALITAALATEHIRSEPSPFVLQTSLNDYHITYELNAYTDRPELMVRTYSELHQNIQDKCNEVGIEILSPSYTAVRDGNHSTIPSDYLPENYQKPSFNVFSKLQRAVGKKRVIRKTFNKPNEGNSDAL